jgi:hypothetical protein
LCCEKKERERDAQEEEARRARTHPRSAARARRGAHLEKHDLLFTEKKNKWSE